MEVIFSEPVRAMVEDGRLSNGHARTILPLSPALQEKAADAVIKSDLSVRQTELLVKKLTAQEKAQPAVTTGGLEVNYAEEAAKSLGAHLQDRQRPQKRPHRAGILRRGRPEQPAGRLKRTEAEINCFT